MIVVLGDIHGRTIWKKILEIEHPDKVIFLGDYVTTHYGISSETQIENLKEILTYKENNPDKVILLRGNHKINKF
jgi:metallophosphoesterase superfamily enzyme